MSFFKGIFAICVSVFMISMLFSFVSCVFKMGSGIVGGITSDTYQPPEAIAIEDRISNFGKTVFSPPKKYTDGVVLTDVGRGEGFVFLSLQVDQSRMLGPVQYLSQDPNSPANAADELIGKFVKRVEKLVKESGKSSFYTFAHDHNLEIVLTFYDLSGEVLSSHRIPPSLSAKVESGVVPSVFGPAVGFDEDGERESAFSKGFRGGKIDSTAGLLNSSYVIPMRIRKDVELKKVSPHEDYVVLEYVAFAPRYASDEWNEQLISYVFSLCASGENLHGFLKRSGVNSRHIVRDLINEVVIDFIITDYDAVREKD